MRMTLKQAKKRSGEKVKDLTTTTKIIFGNGGAVVTRFQDRLDRFLDDLRRLDAATWKVIDEGKDRLYSALDMFVNTGKGKNESFEEVKKNWSHLLESASALGRDIQLVAKRVQKRAARTTNGA